VISAGIYVARILERPEGLGSDLLPEKLLTLSSCLTEMFPGWWAFRWASCTEAARTEAITKLGLPASSLPSLIERVTELFDADLLRWPCVWASVDAARAAVAEFQLDESRFALLELGVPEDVVPVLLEELRPGPSRAASGFVRALEAKQAVENFGVSLGWELLGAEESSFHSWLCNGLQDDAFSKLGVRPGNFGLLPAEHEARAVIELIDAGLGAEPVPWFPAQVMRHDW
jgi:hypothetical protein